MRIRGNISLGKIFGIPLRLHYTWFIVFVLVTVSLVLYFPSDHQVEHYFIEQRIILGILASVLFFASITIHELAHCILAIHCNIPVKEITLFVLGGVSQITKEATHPKMELLIAIVGPLASLAMGSIFYGAHLLAGETLLARFMWWLAIINVILAAFNLIPGFPLDGGRIFRAIVWQRTHNYYKATSIAIKVGQGIAYSFIIGGITIIAAYHLWFNGFWLIFIGWFLHNAARTSYQQTFLRNPLSGITVRHITDYSCPLIPRELNLRDLIQQYTLPTGQNCFLVAKETVLEGMVTLHQIKQLPHTRWDTTSVQDIMTLASKLKVTYPDQDVLTLLQEMDGKNANHMPVIEGGKVIGIVNREDLTRFIRTRVGLGA